MRKYVCVGILTLLYFFSYAVFADRLKCSGIAENITVNVSSEIEFVVTVSENENPEYDIKGEFDGKTLFGRFDVPEK